VTEYCFETLPLTTPGRCTAWKNNDPSKSALQPTQAHIAQPGASAAALHNQCITAHAHYLPENTVWDSGANIGSATQQVLSMRTKLMMRMSTRELRGTPSKL